MSTYISKSKSYLEQYNDFIKPKKTFTVKFYREYEGDGGYWNYYDEWVSGPTVRDIIVEKTFDNLETALGFADTVQETILSQEKEKCNSDKIDMYWMSEFSFNFHNPNNHDLIYAHINWGGSDKKMVLTYNIIEQ